MIPRLRAERTSSATRRDFPRPASAESPTTPPAPASAVSSLAVRAAQLGVSPEDVELVANLALRRVLLRADEGEDRDGLGLSLQRQRRQPLPRERVARRGPDGLRDEHLPRLGLGHQPGGEIDRVTEAAERPAHRMAVGAAAQPSVGDPDLDLLRSGDAFELAELQRGRGGARGVVLVRPRGAEDRVEVGALVAERELERVPAEVVEDALRAADELVELADRLVVAVVVDPAEAHEDGNRRAQLRQELASPRAEPLVDGGQHPRANELERQRRARRRRRFVDLGREPPDDAELPPGLLVRPPLRELDPAPEDGERRLVEDDLLLLGELLRVGQLVDEPAREHLDQLDLGVADDEAPGRADGDCDLQGQANRLA